MTRKKIATVELTQDASVRNITDLLTNGIEDNPVLEAESNEDGTYDVFVEK